MAKQPRKNEKAEDKAKAIQPPPQADKAKDPAVPATTVKLKAGPAVIMASELAEASSRLHQQKRGPGSERREAPAIHLRFKDTIRVINEMLASGTISRYAIGGAVAATFYVEAIRTVDVDIFVPIHQQPGQLIITLDPFTEFLRSRGYSMQDEYWAIEGSLVSFLPVEGDRLLLDAISEPRTFDVEGVQTFVFAPEYLAAIALKVGRSEKDVPRLQQFLREKKVDEARFLEILKRHDLLNAWVRFKAKYLSEAK
jgi:hypothetical protein